MSWNGRNLDPRWVKARSQLQERYAAVSRLPDASRLAYLWGPSTVVTETQIRDLWAEAIANPAYEGESSNNVYIHVPFCKSLCSFCNYERLRPSNPALLEAWLQRVIGSMKTIGPVVSQLEWGSVYIGGGTPSTLPSGMLRRLFTALEEHINVRPDAHKSFEFDPLVMSSGRVQALADHGFSHFSFGIQTLDPEVNKAHNRGFQNRDTVAKRFEELYAAGLYDVACDFLFGLAGTTPETILADIEWVLSEYTPGNVDVFQISPTPEYVEQHFGGSLDAFWAHLEPFQLVAKTELQAMAKRHGYSVNVEGGHRYTLRRVALPKFFKEVPRSCYSYNQLVSEAGRPMNLLGFGPSARSQVFGYAHYRCRDPGDQVLTDAPAVYEGNRITLSEEVRTYLVHQLRDNNHVDRKRFEKIFEKDITEIIPVALSAWDAEGILTIDKRSVSLPKQTRRERLLSLMWLVPEPHLEHEIARRQRLDLTPDGVLRLAGDLEPGQLLAGHHRYGGVDRNGKIVIHTPNRLKVLFRVAPGLDDGAPLRLILESKPPSDKDERDGITRAMVQVRRVLRAGAAHIGS